MVGPQKRVNKRQARPFLRLGNKEKKKGANEVNSFYVHRRKNSSFALAAIEMR